VAETEDQPTSIPGLAAGQLCYLQVPALDVTASAEFYARVFGWGVDPPETGFEAPGLIGQWVTDRPPAPDAGPVGWIHVQDVRATLDVARDAGATLREGPVPDGPRLLASFADPAGNLVGIVQHGDHAPRIAEPGAGVDNRTMPSCTVIPELVYDDVLEAIDWLRDRFGLVERWRAGDHRAQLSIGRCTVAVTEPRTSKALPGHVSLVVRVPDAAAHCERARERGARILAEPRDFPYGECQYTAEDLGGHHWTFSESIADVAPEDWGGTSGPALYACRPAVAARDAGVGVGGAAPADRGSVISVMLIVPDADAAIRWYAGALGAEELWNLGGVAGLHIAGAPFFLHEVNPDNPAETSPDLAGATSVRIEVFVADPDGFVARAVDAGATAGSPVVDHDVPWGTHRQGGFRDPFGHNWSVGDRSPLRSA
jgi:PhnB protein